MTGGTFRPLDSAAVDAIEDAVFQILEEIGLSQAPQSGINHMTAVGAIALTRISFRPSSRARPRVMPITAAFDVV